MVPLDEHKMMEVEGLCYPFPDSREAYEELSYQNQGFWNFYRLANEQYLNYLRHLKMTSTDIQEEDKKRLKIMAYQGANLRYCNNTD